MRFQLHTLAYYIGNFLGALALPEAVDPRDQYADRLLVEIGTKFVRHGCTITFLMAEVALSRNLFAAIVGNRRKPSGKSSKSNFGNDNSYFVQE